MIGQEFASVEREGKYLILSLKPSAKKLVMHFGLTGFLVVTKKSEDVRFSQVRFYFKNNMILHWCDIRKFGKLWLVNDTKEIKGLAQLGPDPLKITQSEFLKITDENESKNVKAFLMDQSIISGIGNEYSDEILFQSGVDPHHRVKDLSEKTRKKIYQEMEKVIHYSIKLRIKNIDKLETQRLFAPDDSKLFKSSYLQAHRHSDRRCPRNKNHMLKKVTIAGRSAYYCPSDQH